MPKRMGQRICLAFLLTVLPGVAGALAAGKPSAMVESVSPATAGLNPMDYVEAGRTIALPEGATLVLDYLGSCTRETITGGTVRIGTEQSVVEHGKLLRSQLDCDGSNLQTSAAESDVPGAESYRALGLPTRPTLTIYATMPIIATSLLSPVTLQRVDGNDPPVSLGQPTPFGRRAVIDFAATGRTLAPGGIYRITQEGRVLVFRVDPEAASGRLPLVQRLLPL
jgi:hypothetical protein